MADLSAAPTGELRGDDPEHRTVYAELGLVRTKGLPGLCAILDRLPGLRGLASAIGTGSTDEERIEHAVKRAAERLGGDGALAVEALLGLNPDTRTLGVRARRSRAAEIYDYKSYEVFRTAFEPSLLMSVATYLQVLLDEKRLELLRDELASSAGLPDAYEHEGVLRLFTTITQGARALLQARIRGGNLSIGPFDRPTSLGANWVDQPIEKNVWLPAHRRHQPPDVYFIREEEPDRNGERYGTAYVIERIDVYVTPQAPKPATSGIRRRLGLSDQWYKVTSLDGFWFYREPGLASRLVRMSVTWLFRHQRTQQRRRRVKWHRWHPWHQWRRWCRWRRWRRWR